MRRIGGSGLLSSCDSVRLRQLALHSTISLIYEAFLHQLLTTPQLLHTASSPSPLYGRRTLDVWNKFEVGSCLYCRFDAANTELM